MLKNNISDSLPLVSIGVASYNNSRYIISTLDSIANQTFKNIEIIVVDDFSTDDSIFLIKEWIAINKKNINIKLISNEFNVGITKVCSKFLENSKGKYLSFFSSDDIMLPNKITDLVEILEKSDDDVAGVFTMAEAIDENGKKLNIIFPEAKINDESKDSLFEQMAEFMVIHTLTTLLKVDKVIEVGGFNEKFWYEDHDLFLRILTRYRLVYEPVMTVQYRIHATQSKTKYEQIVNRDKCRLLFDHYKENKRFKRAFKNGIRRPLRHLASNPGEKSFYIVILYIKYTLFFMDIRGVAFLLQYLIGNNINLKKNKK
jgi:glycosyltransferase involved in cell wall biosynthesis